MIGRVQLGAAAALLVAAGWNAGTAGALLASPLALWLAGLARADDSDHGPYAAGAGATSAGLALALAAAGHAFAAGLAGVGALLASARAVALAERSTELRATGDDPRQPLGARVLGIGAAFVDELSRCVWRVRFKLRGAAALADLAAGVRGAARSLRHREPRDSGALHRLPPLLEKPTVRALRTPRALELRFESTLEPLEVGGDELAAGTLAHAWLLRADPRALRPVVVCIHALGGGSLSREQRRFDAAGLERAGLDVAFLTLPLHGPRRRVRGPWPSGHPLVLSGLVTQSVFELRRLIGWLRREGAPAVGLYGHQIGGTVAALAAAYDRRLAALVVRGTPASLPDSWLAEIGERDRLALAAMGLSRAALEDAWSPAALLSSEPRVATDARLIVAGRRDRICTPEQTRALWEHWGRPPIHWHEGAHWLPVGREALGRTVREHLRERLHAAAEAAELPLTRFRS
ncbi:MAG: alpha/beta hydrolase family protein [Myxococcota bacterium]|nr:alpha/beta hydrolase family protein [Myxococcota bacterium]